MVIVENVGTVVKININVEPVGGIHMEEMPFRCRFFTYSNRSVEVDKGEMIRVDADNYVAVVDTTHLGMGEIRCRLTVDVPDGDVPGSFRREIVTFNTGIQMQP